LLYSDRKLRLNRRFVRLQRRDGASCDVDRSPAGGDAVVEKMVGMAGVREVQQLRGRKLP
jgi:hypothetical protein